jgi:tight adherence protein C
VFLGRPSLISLQIIIPLIFAAGGGVLFVISENENVHAIPVVAEITNHFRKRQDRTNVRSRLSRIDRDGDYESFCIRQVVISSFAGGLSIILGLIILGSSIQVLLISIIFCSSSFVLVDRSLTKEVNRRKSAIENEFAPVIEMLTLSLSAGQTPLGAMDRIAERSDGYLAREFKRVVISVREGESFHAALDAMGVRIDSVIIRRFVDSLITAILRGAPLVEVLQRHALEARAVQRNVLMDKAGKAEISMMIPVVFLILPISVLFALWPSLTNLNLLAS